MLSAGSKQVALPVLFALPAYVWLADGRRAAIRYGALLAVLHVASKDLGIGRVTARKSVTILMTVVLTVSAVQLAPRLRSQPETVRDLPNDTVASAFRFAREHPGEVYLPYHPLVSLMAEGRAYHLLLETISQQSFEYLADGPDLEASTADDAAFFRFVPENLRYVLYRVDGGTPMTGLRRGYEFRDHLWRYRPMTQMVVPVASDGAAGKRRHGTIVRAGWRTRSSATRPSSAMAFAPGVQLDRGVRSSSAVRSSIG